MQRFLCCSPEKAREAVGGGKDEEEGEEVERRGGRGCGRSGEGGAARATDFKQAEPRTVALVTERARAPQSRPAICGLRRRDRAERWRGAPHCCCCCRRGEKFTEGLSVAESVAGLPVKLLRLTKRGAKIKQFDYAQWFVHLRSCTAST